MTLPDGPTPFGPSDTQNWLRCPQYRALVRTWNLPADQWTPHMLIGTALHAGMARFFTASPADPLAIAKSMIETGYPVEPPDQWPLKESIAALHQAYRGVLPLWTTIRDTETVLKAEICLIPDVTHTRADLVTITSGGDLAVTDLKFTLKPPESSAVRLKRLEEYEASFQLFCYGYWTQEKYQLPVRWLRVLQAYGSKHPAVLYPFKLVDKALAQWLRGAEWAWAQMEREDQGLQIPAPNLWSCNGRYGRCHYYTACHTAYGDPKMMHALGYTPVEPANATP